MTVSSLRQSRSRYEIHTRVKCRNRRVKEPGIRSGTRFYIYNTVVINKHRSSTKLLFRKWHLFLSVSLFSSLSLLFGLLFFPFSPFLSSFLLSYVCYLPPFLKNIRLTTPISLSTSYYTLLFISFPHILNSSFEQLIPPTNFSFTTILPVLHSVFSYVDTFLCLPSITLFSSQFLHHPVRILLLLFLYISTFQQSHYYLILSPISTGC